MLLVPRSHIQLEECLVTLPGGPHVVASLGTFWYPSRSSGAFLEEVPEGTGTSYCLSPNLAGERDCVCVCVCVCACVCVCMCVCKAVFKCHSVKQLNEDGMLDALRQYGPAPGAQKMMDKEMEAALHAIESGARPRMHVNKRRS